MYTISSEDDTPLFAVFDGTIYKVQNSQEGQLGYGNFQKSIDKVYYI